MAPPLQAQSDSKTAPTPALPSIPVEQTTAVALEVCLSKAVQEGDMKAAQTEGAGAAMKRRTKAVQGGRKVAGWMEGLAAAVSS